MDIRAAENQAFSIWLRTGRWPGIGEVIELSSPDRHREAQIAYVRNYFGDNRKIIEPNYEEIYKRGFKLN